MSEINHPFIFSQNSPHGETETLAKLMLLMATSVPGQRASCQERSDVSSDKSILLCQTILCHADSPSKAWEHVAPGLGTTAPHSTDGSPFEKSCKWWERKKIKEVCLSLMKTLVSEMPHKILGNVCLQTCVIKYNKQNNCHVALWVTVKVCVCVCVGGCFSFGLN